MFYGTDPEHHAYRGRAHLVEMIALIGPPPPDFVARGRLRAKFFSEEGEHLDRLLLDFGFTLARLASQIAAADVVLPWFLGKFHAGIDLPPPSSLEEIETNLDGKDKEQFMQLMRKMLQWVPEHRSTAKELLHDPWLQEQL